VFLAEIAVIDNKSLDDLMKRLAKEMDKNRVVLLKAKLEAGARKCFMPRLWAKAGSA
jgi:tRNA A37 threonylcarbamoyladenosine biosynthesis protein TsaE